MKKNIFLLGSTGSIGLTALKILKKDKKNFNLKLLTTNKSVNKIYSQALEFNVKQVVIFNKKEYLKKCLKFKKKILKYSFLLKIFLKQIKKNPFLPLMQYLE